MDHTPQGTWYPTGEGVGGEVATEGHMWYPTEEGVGWGGGHTPQWYPTEEGVGGEVDHTPQWYPTGEGHASHFTVSETSHLFGVIPFQIIPPMF